MVKNTKRRHKTPTISNDNKERENAAKQLVLDKCCLELYEAAEKNDGRKPYRIVTEMVNDLKSVCPWITRHTINFAYRKFIATKEKRLEEESPDVKGNQSLGGRPVGSTMEAKVELKS